MLSLSILSSCCIFTGVLFETQGARLFSTFQFLYSYFFSRGLAWQNGWIVTGVKSWKNQGNVNARMQLTRHPDPIRSRLVSGNFSLCKPLFFYCCDAIKVLSWIAPWRLPTCKRLRYCDTHPDPSSCSSFLEGASIPWFHQPKYPLHPFIRTMPFP